MRQRQLIDTIVTNKISSLDKVANEIVKHRIYLYDDDEDGNHSTNEFIDGTIVA